jgi:DNA-binding transcriptional ArsR family regulator
MRKLLEIQRHVNLADEAFTLLYYWINKDDMEATFDIYSEYYQSNADSYCKKYNLLLDIYQYVKDNLQVKKEILEYYFKLRGAEFTCYGALALLGNNQKNGNEICTYEEYFSNITEKQKIKQYALIINGEEAMNLPEELNSFSELVTFIDSSSYDQVVKWEFIKIYHNQEKYFDEVRGIISKVINLMTSKYSEQITNIEQEFYEYWSNVEKEDGIIATIRKQLNLTLEISEQGTVIEPLLFLPFSVIVSIKEGIHTIRDVIRLSILLDKRMVVADRKIKKDDVINIGKLLSDKSKVDILEIVSKRPSYGKEIANELELSTATISYHVNTLLKEGFLKADVNSNKVYYSINRDRISACLGDIKNYFVGL